MKTRLLFLVTTVAFTAPAAAYDRAKANDNMASDYSRCAAYFGVVAAGLQESDPLAVKADAQALKASERAAALSNQKLHLARMKMWGEAMMRTMDYKPANIALVASEYAYPCKDLMEKPEERMRHYLEMSDRG